MARFRIKPTVIEAVRVSKRTVIPPQETFYQHIYVVYPGEYLCIDGDGYKFPCRPEVFEKLYELVAE